MALSFAPHIVAQKFISEKKGWQRLEKGDPAAARELAAIKELQDGPGFNHGPYMQKSFDERAFPRGTAESVIAIMGAATGGEVKDFVLLSKSPDKTPFHYIIYVAEGALEKTRQVLGRSGRFTGV